MNDQVFVRPVSLEGKPLGPAIEIGTMGYRMVDASGEVVQEVNWITFEEEAELDAQGSDGEEKGSAGSDWECLECGASPESIWWCLAQATWLARRAISRAWVRLIGKDGK